MLNHFQFSNLIISHLLLFCALKHAPEVTPLGLNFSLEDWQFFKVIINNSKEVLNAMKVLAGKQKMPEDLSGVLIPMTKGMVLGGSEFPDPYPYPPVPGQLTRPGFKTPGIP
jgi:hypothetical protein